MHALDGIRVLDLTRLAPGPHCTIGYDEASVDALRSRGIVR